MADPKDDPCCATRVAVLEADLASIRREVALAHKAHEDLHVEANKVLGKDAELMRERLAQMNEFREEGRMVQSTYVRQEVYDSKHLALSDKVYALEKTTAGAGVVQQLEARLSAAETALATAQAKLLGHSSGVTQTQALIGAMVALSGLIIAAVGLTR